MMALSLLFLNLNLFGGEKITSTSDAPRQVLRPARRRIQARPGVRRAPADRGEGLEALERG